MNAENSIDPKEIDLPETEYIRDMDNRVFQTIVLQVIADTDGIHLMENSLIDNLFGRDSLDRIKNIHIQQDSHSQSLSIKLEVTIDYGLSIPEKASQLQNKIIEEITRLTGLHVASVHVLFKGVNLSEKAKKDLGLNRSSPHQEEKLVIDHLE